jgi:H+-transporting ATPase
MATGQEEAAADSSNTGDEDGPHPLNSDIEAQDVDEKTTDVNPEDYSPHEEYSPQEEYPPSEYRTNMIHLDEDEDEDMDALIDELESEDGHAEEEEREPDDTQDGARVVPDELLHTDAAIGLTEQEVFARRRRYGMNQMKEEKENLVLKFLSYFIGPIQFVMEVSLTMLSALPILDQRFATTMHMGIIAKLGFSIP